MLCVGCCLLVWGLLSVPTHLTILGIPLLYRILHPWYNWLFNLALFALIKGVVWLKFHQLGLLPVLFCHFFPQSQCSHNWVFLIPHWLFWGGLWRPGFRLHRRRFACFVSLRWSWRQVPIVEVVVIGSSSSSSEFPRNGVIHYYYKFRFADHNLPSLFQTSSWCMFWCLRSARLPADYVSASPIWSVWVPLWSVCPLGKRPRLNSSVHSLNSSVRGRL